MNANFHRTDEPKALSAVMRTSHAADNAFGSSALHFLPLLNQERAT